MRLLLLLCMVMASSIAGHAQTGDDFTKEFEEDFESFRKSSKKDFDNFRRKCNEEYAAFLKNPWRAFENKAPRPLPKDEQVQPVVRPEDDKTVPVTRPVKIEEIVPATKPTPQPVPVSPIKERMSEEEESKSTFKLFGTPMSVRSGCLTSFKLGGTGEGNVSRAWQELSANGFADNLVHDCLELRRSRQLCDWAYLAMLKEMSESICGPGTNEAVLLMAYVYCQSGYRMRLARDNANRIYMLFASRHMIYERIFFKINNECYYPYGKCPESLYICEIAFPKEQSLSLMISESPKFGISATQTKHRQSAKYPDVSVSIAANSNLIDFFNTYPASMIDGDIMTRWAMLADTPMSKDMQSQLYPSLRKAISGYDQHTAVNRLLNFVQTGFTYEYDDKVWGCDRAFFSEESLYYPYCDCEDRSILFTRLVRDLLGLRCILIYYPGHLASAVEFTEDNVQGDYIQLAGRRFVIADATYIGAPVGLTMPEMDNRSAKVILLSASCK